jgi:hypothetical protein
MPRVEQRDIPHADRVVWARLFLADYSFRCIQCRNCVPHSEEEHEALRKSWAGREGE